MKALVCYERAAGCIELRELPKPRLAADEVLVQVAYTGICGSDIKLYHGRHPHATPPIVPGHEFSGIVCEIGDSVTKLQPGDHVTGLVKRFPKGVSLGSSENMNLIPGTRTGGLHCDGAFATYVAMNERFAFKLPDNVSLKAASVTEPLCVALHAVLSRSRVLPTHRVLVSGPGAIGLLVTQAVRLQGADVLVAGLTTDEERLALARRLGATMTVDIEKENLLAVVADFSGGQGIDVAFECVGAAGSVNNCLSTLRAHGQYVQVGTFGFGEQVEVLLNHVLFNELTVAGVFGHVLDEWQEAIRLLSQGKVNTEIVVSHVFPLGQWQDAFEAAERKAGIKVLIQPCE